MNLRPWITVAVAAALAVTAVSADDKPAKQTPPKEKPAKSKAKAKLGDAAPQFTLTDCDGKTFDLSAMKDKVVVLEWFNKDCPFCKMYCNDLKGTAAKYAEKGVVWAAVDSTHVRKAEENAAYAKKNKIDYPILSDFDGKVGRLYGATNTPHVFIINKGTLAYVGAFVDKNDKKKNYVADALDNILADEPVKKAKTRPFG